MSKKQELIEVNTDNYFRNNIFSNAIRYGEQNKGVNGVAEVLKAINEKQNTYLIERDNFVKEKNESIKMKLEKAKKKRMISRITLLLCVVILLLNLLISIPLLINVILFGAMFWTYLTYDDARGKYNHEVSDAKRVGESICRKYDTDAQKYYAHIDDLYLASLDPVHREIVMMHRNQERHNQEMIRIQSEHNERMEEEQKRTRIAQEELLRIEREREERVRSNRY